MELAYPWCLASRKASDAGGIGGWSPVDGAIRTSGSAIPGQPERREASDAGDTGEQLPAVGGARRASFHG